MSYESGLGGLHAGLIERARPRRTLPPGVVRLNARRPGDGDGPPEPASQVRDSTEDPSLLARRLARETTAPAPSMVPVNGTARAAPVDPQPVPSFGTRARSGSPRWSDDTFRSADTPAAPTFRSVPSQMERGFAQDAMRTCPRIGLTVRVDRDLRARLSAEQDRTGRTAQAILHDALTLYLRSN